MNEQNYKVGMLKVKNIFINPEGAGDYKTGLLYEMEDGTFIEECSSDICKPYNVIK